MTVSVSLDSLPEDLLVEISSCVAASSLSEISNLRLVSKSFKRINNDGYILRRLSLNEIPLFPWFHNRVKFHNFFKSCRKNGNPEAIYRKGLVDYFHRNSSERQRDKGLNHIAKVANKGNQEEAQYVYGLILICLGGETKQKGFKILSSLRKPLMSSTLEEMEKHRKKIRDEMWWCGEPMMRHLKRRYVRENCNCDGRTEMFFVKNSGWDRYGKHNDMITSSACEICLWHHEVKLFFANIEE
ncbi:F-box-like domain superfamily [Arabidopsis thaliana x Arabidopsis arenosa]|uniref:F-box-like domain superfamily n=1 Tax=Arabidopsis thaliana x Arabidopsis arenosa TaxID=1240361 RepID=A0A8T2BU83_9BRAS|nr:F-box-like domain superfamily [Arabidopsis thaliana x Arabidopsis arenosa]